MRGNDVIGCPTGEMIRVLVRQRLATETDSSFDPDFYGTVPELDEHMLGIEIHAPPDTLRSAWGIISQSDVEMILSTLILLLPDRMVSPHEFVPDEIMSGLRPVLTVGGSAADSLHCTLDRMTALRDWERRNQSPTRPPRHIRGGKHRLK